LLPSAEELRKRLVPRRRERKRKKKKKKKEKKKEKKEAKRNKTHPPNSLDGTTFQTRRGKNGRTHEIGGTLYIWKKNWEFCLQSDEGFELNV
jgi:hypothetical protein